MYNFWKYLFAKIAAHVLGPDHIVTSLEHLGTVPGVQVMSLFVLGLRHVQILLTNRYWVNYEDFTNRLTQVYIILQINVQFAYL
jgi:hypothetical protein